MRLLLGFCLLLISSLVSGYRLDRAVDSAGVTGHTTVNPKNVTDHSGLNLHLDKNGYHLQLILD